MGSGAKRKQSLIDDDFPMNGKSKKSVGKKQKKLTNGEIYEVIDSTVIDRTLSALDRIKFDIKPKNTTQKKLINCIKQNDVTVCSGPAGTGKTLVSVSEALKLLKGNNDIYKQIILVKSITQLRNEDIGILPGDEKMKLKFQMMSYMDAFYKLIGESATHHLMDVGLIKFEVFGAIRGRSISDAIIIVDEFQNVNHDNAKTFLTRFSENTKTIVLGDTNQIDIKNKKDSSLGTLIDKIKLHPIEGVDVVEFSEDEIVRHRLTTYFLNLFKEIV